MATTVTRLSELCIVNGTPEIISPNMIDMYYMFTRFAMRNLRQIDLSAQTDQPERYKFTFIFSNSSRYFEARLKKIAGILQGGIPNDIVSEFANSHQQSHDGGVHCSVADCDDVCSNESSVCGKHFQLLTIVSLLRDMNQFLEVWGGKLLQEDLIVAAKEVASVDELVTLIVNSSTLKQLTQYLNVLESVNS
eukprot:TRINITY_DN12740_c0_g1_i1.p1 TRINITY_DN12740_c0_g1~~TRINITY_DN12740_c0_g1_i1.p1  ORF type:complete len:192 (+),score=27.28 TRINITY_DN12740_c0_g1_i1:787-1362(+)